MLKTNGGGVSATFRASGPVVRFGGVELGLSFMGVGRGTELAGAGPATPVASGNRVSYRRSGLTEWYSNGPAGLEQGFTVERPPAGGSVQGLLTVAVRATGPVRLSRDGSEVVIAGSAGGAPLARYGGLSAVDASGRSLPSRLVLRNGTLLLRVDDAGARYPLTIDPLIYGQSIAANTAATLTAASGINGPVGVAFDAAGNLYITNSGNDTVRWFRS